MSYREEKVISHAGSDKNSEEKVLAHAGDNEQMSRKRIPSPEGRFLPPKPKPLGEPALQFDCEKCKRPNCVMYVWQYFCQDCMDAMDVKTFYLED